jgi:hypothetical protein
MRPSLSPQGPAQQTPLLPPASAKQPNVRTPVAKPALPRRNPQQDMYRHSPNEVGKPHGGRKTMGSVSAVCCCLMPVTLATWEAKITRITVWGQPRQIVHKTPSSKNNQSKMDWRHTSSSRAPALQSQSPEFKPKSHPKKASGLFDATKH